MKICVLGAINEKLDADLRDKISSCDILFVPVLEHEKNNYLSAKDAVAVANNLEAKIIIPVGFDDKTLPTFLKEAGATAVRAIEKLTIKKKELDGKEGVVVVLDEI
jgi:L-ascorbate metabolism protein UlaG (beta-lactamase superfamily)